MTNNYKQSETQPMYDQIQHMSEFSLFEIVGAKNNHLVVLHVTPWYDHGTTVLDCVSAVATSH